MKILSVHIDGFGKFKELDLEFGPDMNVIRGRNEAGKSTLQSFMEAMLLGPSRKPRGFSRSVHESMEPWDETAAYGGSMRIEYGDRVYRIERVFSAGKESLSVVNEATGSVERDPELFLKQALEGLSPEACRSTISVGQLSVKTGVSLQKELNSYVENMGGTAAPDLNAERAIRLLEERRDSLKERIRKDAARDYAAALSRIKNIENELNQPENENQILRYEGQRKAVRECIDAVKACLKMTEEKIEGETAELKEHGIHTRDDVTAEEKQAEERYDSYCLRLKKKKNPLRFAAIIVAGLLIGASVTGLVLYPDGTQKNIILAAGAAALLLLLVLILIQVLSWRKFGAAEKEMREFMEARNGAKSVNPESYEGLKKHIHKWDGLLNTRDEDRKEKERLEDELSGLIRQDAELSSMLALQGKIQVHVEGRLSEENTLRDQASVLRQRIAENNRLKEQIDAIDIAIDTIGDLSRSIRSRLGTYLNNEASRVLEKLTGGHYRSMDIGNGSDMTLNSSLGMIGAGEVSAGTVDQIYLAVRLAAARFMMREKDSLPLLFDDSFALYDDERLKSAVNFVDSDYQGQIFVFTCHHREENALEGKKFRLVEL